MAICSGITVGLQQTSYNTLETGGPLHVCAQIFVGNLEKNVTLSLISTDDSAKGMLRMHVPNYAIAIYVMKFYPCDVASVDVWVSKLSH